MWVVVVVVARRASASIHCCYTPVYGAVNLYPRLHISLVSVAGALVLHAAASPGRLGLRHCVCLLLLLLLVVCFRLGRTNVASIMHTAASTVAVVAVVIIAVVARTLHV